ncbi:hypothetical protein SAMN05444678_1262 [Sphingomonas sp. YR710]|nr:hypothetical protein SAMN05444678_1262 [Sphingomonas sp. YR710]
MGTNVTYHHSNGKCVKTENYSDGCSRRTESSLKSGKVLSESKHKSTGHKNW